MMRWLLKTLGVLLVINFLWVGGALALGSSQAATFACLSLTDTILDSTADGPILRTHKEIFDVRTGIRQWVEQTLPANTEITLLIRRPDGKYGLYIDSSDGQGNGYLIATDPALPGTDIVRLPRPNTPPSLSGIRFDQRIGLWSPDNQRLAYLWRDDSYNEVLSILGMDGSRVSLPRLSDFYNPLIHSWSADNQLLATTVGLDTNFALHIWQTQPPRLLSLAPGLASDKAMFEIGQWSPTGNTFAAISTYGQTRAELSLLRPSAEDGQLQRLALLPVPFSYEMEVAWSPDSRYITLIYYSLGEGKRLQLYQLSAEGQVTELGNFALGNSFLPQRPFYWVDDGETLLLWRSGNDSSQLAAITPASGEETLMAADVRYEILTNTNSRPLTSEGNLLTAQRLVLPIYQQGKYSVQLYNLDLPSSQSMTTLVAGADKISGIYWSPDGQQLLVHWLKEDDTSYFTWADNVGGNAQTIASQVINIAQLRWLRGNQQVLYGGSAADNKHRVGVLTPATGESITLVEGLFQVGSIGQDKTDDSIYIWWQDSENHLQIAGFLPNGQPLYRFRSVQAQGPGQTAELARAPNNAAAIMLISPSADWSVQWVSNNAEPTRVLVPAVYKYYGLPFWSPDSGYFSFAYSVKTTTLINSDEVNYLAIYNAKGDHVRWLNPVLPAFQAGQSVWSTCAPAAAD
jgi:hypothetical protein